MMRRVFCLGLAMCAVRLCAQAQANDMPIVELLNKVGASSPESLKERQRIEKWEPEYKKHVQEVPLPKITFVKKEDYPAERQLLELDKSDIPAMLKENYTFKDFHGNQHTIPAGFIFDGASVPKEVQDMAWSLTSVNARQIGSYDPNSVAAALIHDYCYRNPQVFSKEDADLLFRFNLEATKSPGSGILYSAVVFGGDSSYNGHVRNYKEGEYQVFTPEHYALNVMKDQDKDAFLPRLRDALLSTGWPYEERKKLMVFYQSAHEKGVSKDLILDYFAALKNGDFTQAMTLFARFQTDFLTAAKANNTMNVKVGSGWGRIVQRGFGTHSGEALPSLTRNGFSGSRARTPYSSNAGSGDGFLFKREEDPAPSGIADMQSRLGKFNSADESPRRQGTGQNGWNGDSYDMGALFDEVERRGMELYRQAGGDEEDISAYLRSSERNNMRNSAIRGGTR